MCRLLAYLGPPRSLRDLLIAPEHSLVRQSYAPRHQRHGHLNADGFGVGWYDTATRPEPARYRRDRPIWSDHSLVSMAPLVASGAVVAAVRDATPPAVVEESGSPPFTSGPWLFAHNGAVEGFADGVGEALRQRLTPRRRGGIEGSSDSEVVFALVLDALDAGADLGAALASAVGTVGGEAQARLNLVLCDGVHLAAAVWGDTMFALDLGADHPEPAVVVASEPWDNDPAWVQIPDASIVEVDAQGLRLSSLTGAEASSPGSGALGAGTPSSGALSNPVRVEVHLGPEDIATSLRHDVRQGLTSAHKWLPPKWFYDEAGSELFDQITRLAEYYPTRCETEILAARADEIAAASGADTLVELGSGTSAKTRLLLDGLTRAGSLRRVVPFDVSEATLRRAAEDLAQSYPGTTVHALVGDFERHLRHLPQGGTRLVAFLGGTIGNLEPTQRAAFLSEVATELAPGDSLLLGTDLIKSPARLVAAYDDAAGVTARFNTNVLNVINRELDADFDETSFAHLAGWNAEDERIEMRLRSLVDQAVYLAALDLKVDFVAGEELRTECSAKFNRRRVEAELTSAGLQIAHWWTDQAGDFALSLAIPAHTPVSR